MHWLIWLLIVIIVIVIILLIINYVFFKTGAFDIFKIAGGNIAKIGKPWAKYVTFGDKATIEDITDSGFALKHNGDNVTIHGTKDIPITIRRKDLINGKITSDKTIKLQSNYNLQLIETGKDENVDIFIEFISYGKA